MDVVYTVVYGRDSDRLVDELRDLYAEVYAEPPYCEGPTHVAQFVRWLTDEIDKPGFTVAMARSRAGGLAGAAYGFTLPAGEWMEPAATEPPAHIRNVPKFNIAEWMVSAAYRCHGIGRHLLDLLLAGRTEPWAVLASNPAAAARQIYERWGWKQYGRIAPRTMPPMDVLALRLPCTATDDALVDGPQVT
jgi:GNAT superfamily N-acetyltransferase